MGSERMNFVFVLVCSVPCSMGQVSNVDSMLVGGDKNHIDRGKKSVDSSTRILSRGIQLGNGESFNTFFNKITGVAESRDVQPDHNIDEQKLKNLGIPVVPKNIQKYGNLLHQNAWNNFFTRNK